MNTGERIEWKKVKVGKQTQSNLPPATSTSPPRIPIQLESFHQINLETYIITISIKISIKIIMASNHPGGLKYHHHLHQYIYQDQGGNLTELSLRTAISSERRPRLLELLLSMSWGSNQAKEQTLDSHRSGIHIKPKGYGKVYICLGVW